MHPTTLTSLSLPAIGAPFQGGKFAGILTGTDGTPYVLILLNDKPAADVGPNQDGTLPWQDAIDWARNGLGADLPSRPEAALLFQLLKPEFEERIHWLNETTSWSTSSAWGQFFDHGIQSYSAKSYAFRCRAVRRFSLESFNALSAGEEQALSSADLQAA